MNGVDVQKREDITVEELHKALKNSHKWKSPGVDKIPNFLLNALSEIQQQLTNSLNTYLIG